MTRWPAVDSIELDCDDVSYAPCRAREGSPARMVIARIAEVDRRALSALLEEAPLDRSPARLSTFTALRLQPQTMQVPDDLDDGRPRIMLLALVAATIAAAGLIVFGI